MRATFCWLLAWCAASGSAQGHPYLSRFELVEQFGRIKVEWTLVAGNTCYDIEVLRGTDTTAVEPIGTIYGLCGNISEPVDYAFTDAEPIPFATAYYRLVLGSGGPTAFKSIRFDQLREADIRLTDLGHGTIGVLLNVSEGTDVELRCWSIHGRMLAPAIKAKGGNHRLILPLGVSTCVLVEATGRGFRNVGRVVVVD